VMPQASFLMNCLFSSSSIATPGNISVLTNKPIARHAPDEFDLLRHFVNPSTGIVAFVKVVEVDFGTSRGLVERSLTVPLLYGGP